MICAIVFTLMNFLYASSDYPKGWEEFIHLDQDFNIPYRHTDLMTNKEKSIKRFFLYTLNPDMIQLTQSGQVAQDSRFNNRQMIFSSVWGDEKLIDYFNKLGVPREEYLGVKMTSSSTYLVWKKDDLLSEPFFVKNQSVQLESLRILKEDLVDYPHHEIDILPESYTVFVASTFSRTFREDKTVHGVSAKKLIPLHALIASGKLKEISAKVGMGENEWLIKILMPMLARTNGKLQFDFALFLDSHTQNLLLEFDEETFALKAIDYRDFSAANYDLLYRSFIKKKQPTRILKSLMDANKWFISQSIFHLTANRDLQMLMAESYFLEYLKLARHYLPQEKIDSLRQKFYESVFIRKIPDRILTEAVKFHMPVPEALLYGELLTEVYKTIKETHIRNYLSEHPEVVVLKGLEFYKVNKKNFQILEASEYKKALKENDVEFILSYDQKTLAVLRKSDFKVMAYRTNLLETERKQLLGREMLVCDGLLIKLFLLLSRK